jgi:hypothetical protein
MADVEGPERSGLLRPPQAGYFLLSHFGMRTYVVPGDS